MTVHPKAEPLRHASLQDTCPLVTTEQINPSTVSDPQYSRAVLFFYSSIPQRFHLCTLQTDLERSALLATIEGAPSLENLQYEVSDIHHRHGLLVHTAQRLLFCWLQECAFYRKECHVGLLLQRLLALAFHILQKRTYDREQSTRSGYLIRPYPSVIFLSLRGM